MYKSIIFLFLSEQLQQHFMMYRMLAMIISGITADTVVPTRPPLCGSAATKLLQKVLLQNYWARIKVGGFL